MVKVLLIHYRLSKEQPLTVTPCPYPHWRPVFGSSYNEFVFPGCWHFDNGATSKIYDILTEHCGLLNVLPLAVPLNFDIQVGGPF